MADELDENNVGPADHPVKVAHGDNGAQGEISEEGDKDNVEPLLLHVGVDGKDRGGMLCGVVSAVELPQSVGLVHDAVVPVEPKVDGDGVSRDHERQPGRESDGSVWVVDDKCCSEGSEKGGHEDRVENLANSDIGNTIAGCLRLEESYSGSNLAKNVDQVRTKQRNVGGPVQDIDNRVERASSPLGVEILDSDGGKDTHGDPKVELRVAPHGDWVILFVNNGSCVLRNGIDAGEMDEPVGEAPG